MRILLIDNYDSFTYNLYQLLARVSGSLPRVAFNDCIRWEEIVAWQPDLIVLSPGPGRPERAADFGICETILREWEGPIFGVCLGFQGMVWVEGGEIVHAPEPMHGRLSPLLHAGTEPMFADISSGAEVVRYHSLAAASQLPETLIPTAWTEDGLLMAARHRDKAWWGVQYHPESIATESGEQLIKNILHQAGLTPQPVSGMTNQVPERRFAENQQKWELLWEPFEWDGDDSHLFEQVFGEKEAAFWLDSSAAGTDSGGWSFLGAYGEGPHDQLLIHHLKTGLCEIRGAEDCIPSDQMWDYLAQHQTQQVLSTTDSPFPFVGGWLGWLGYESRTSVGLPVAQYGETPDVALWFCTRFVALDQETGKGYVVALFPSTDATVAQEWLLHTRNQILSLRGELVPEEQKGSLLSPLHLRHDQPTYLGQIAEAQQAIREGESYEICLTNEWETTYQGDPLPLYRQLRQINPAPYAAFFRLGDHSILSSSPERFLQIDPDGRMTSKPIKGTLERSPDPVQDARLRAQLAASLKDQAENLMIVDLLRNDLGKISEIGSVQVPTLMGIESFASVHQMVSTVQAQLQAGLTPWEVLTAAFPGGSITGAPKRRTMELIEELEQRPRGVYTGSIGYVGLDGRSDWNIAIRTITLDGTQLRMGSGGAITYLSDPRSEFREILLKSLPLLRAIQAACGHAPDDWSFLHGIQPADWQELFHPPVGIS